MTSKSRKQKLTAVAVAGLSLPLTLGGQALASDAASAPDESAALDPAVVNPAALDAVTAEAISIDAVAINAIPVDALAGESTDAEPPVVDPTGPSEAQLEQYAAFWNAGYNYNQLLALASEWEVDEFEAKAQAGALILAGNAADFATIVEGIADAQASNAAASFFDAGFSYQDAQTLAGEWNLDTYSAKVAAAEIIDAGDIAELNTLLNG